LPVGADGLAYLDVARAYLHHDWPVAINGYWGPLYSWLLAAALRIAHPDASQEFALVRVVNFLLLVLVVLAFGRFWRKVATWNRRQQGECLALANAAPKTWIVLGYILLSSKVLWMTQEVTPDLLVAAMVLLTSAQLINLSQRTTSPKLSGYVYLGFLLAAGFYAKAILFYFAVFVLLGLAFQSFSSKMWRGAIVAALVFVIAVSPFVVLLTRTLGHVTAGDSGRLNYAWFVDGTETQDWVKAGGAPVPFYPGKLIFDSPRVFSVPRLHGVTYAPWYDAARFDKHSRPAFNLRGQMRQLVTNLKSLSEEFLGTDAALLVCLMILICAAPMEFARRFVAAWFCALPALAIIGMYLLVHLVDRFTLGFMLVLWGVVYSCVSIPTKFQSLTNRALLSGILILAARTMPGVLHFVVSPAVDAIRRDAVIAAGLPVLGVQPEDPVAVIGQGEDSYWAHWAEASVVAELWSIDATAFWSGPPELQHKVLNAMAEAGAKAVVWRRDSDRMCPSGWTSLPEQSGCLMSLYPVP
jgi:hypothetical protein